MTRETARKLPEAVLYFSDLDNCIGACEFPPLAKWRVVPDLRQHWRKVLQRRASLGVQESASETAVPHQEWYDPRGSPIGLDKWLIAMWLLVDCNNGISSYETHRAIKVTQETAWFMMHRICSATKQSSF
jgi:hypothetical protein